VKVIEGAEQKGSAAGRKEDEWHRHRRPVSSPGVAPAGSVAEERNRELGPLVCVAAQAARSAVCGPGERHERGPGDGRTFESAGRKLGKLGRGLDAKDQNGEVSIGSHRREQRQWELGPRQGMAAIGTEPVRSLEVLDPR